MPRGVSDQAGEYLESIRAKYGSARKDEEVSEAFGCSTATVERLRKRWVELGMDEALEHENCAPRQCKLDGDAEAVLIATACTKAPAGHSRWTVRLLADKLVELGVVESCSHMTVQRTMKKTS